MELTDFDTAAQRELLDKVVRDNEMKAFARDLDLAICEELVHTTGLSADLSKEIGKQRTQARNDVMVARATVKVAKARRDALPPEQEEGSADDVQADVHGSVYALPYAEPVECVNGVTHAEARP